MGHPNRSMDNKAKGDLNFGNLAQEVSEGRKDSTSKPEASQIISWARM